MRRSNQTQKNKNKTKQNSLKNRKNSSNNQHKRYLNGESEETKNIRKSRAIRGNKKCEKLNIVLFFSKIKGLLNVEAKTLPSLIPIFSLERILPAASNNTQGDSYIGRIIIVAERTKKPYGGGTPRPSTGASGVLTVRLDVLGETGSPGERLCEISVSMLMNLQNAGLVQLGNGGIQNVHGVLQTCNPGQEHLHSYPQLAEAAPSCWPSAQGQKQSVRTCSTRI